MDSPSRKRSLPDAEGRSGEVLVVDYAKNEDGWVTARIREYPAAISQGRDHDAAFANVIAALHDLLGQ